MKIQEVIDRILAYHPALNRDKTCDGFKTGNPEDECTGIVTTCCASVEVIRKTIELGANLIICHEPAFYLHYDPTDWLEGKNEVYDEKRKLCDDHGIAIWRDHDHIHTHKPDGIRQGLMMELGWQDYLVGDTNKPIRFHLPETTVRELALFLKEKIGLNGVRVIGNLDAKVRNVVVCGHILPSPANETAATELLNSDDVDVIIPGECIDWTTACYARDAGQLGKNKALISLGHINSEELGMKYAAVWVRELVGDEVKVQYVKSADLYQYVF